MSNHSFSELLTALWKKPPDDSIELDKAMALTRQMLDQVERLVELNSARDICSVVANLPLKWASRKARTSRKPSIALAFASTSKNESDSRSARKYYRKRRRLSMLR